MPSVFRNPFSDEEDEDELYYDEEFEKDYFKEEKKLDIKQAVVYGMAGGAMIMAFTIPDFVIVGAILGAGLGGFAAISGYI